MRSVNFFLFFVNLCVFCLDFWVLWVFEFCFFSRILCVFFFLSPPVFFCMLFFPLSRSHCVSTKISLDKLCPRGMLFFQEFRIEKKKVKGWWLPEDILNLPMPNLQFTPVAASKMIVGALIFLPGLCLFLFACFIYFKVCLFCLPKCIWLECLSDAFKKTETSKV